MATAPTNMIHGDWHTSPTDRLLTIITAIPLFPALLLVPSIFLLILYLQRSYLHPLSRIPGPALCRLTSLHLYIHSYLGDEARQITRLHNIYGPIVRIGPNEVVVADGAVLSEIYTLSENPARGGFLKAPCYENFHGENGHETIFSTLDPEYRKVRAKAVMPLFGAAELRKGNAVLEDCVQRFVRRLKVEARRSVKGRKRVDVLALARMLALDSVSEYLFGECYGAIEQGVTANKDDGIKDEMNAEIHLDAGAYVESITAFGRFFFLPNNLFLKLMSLIEYFSPDPRAAASLAKVDAYVIPMVDRAASGAEEMLVGTFQDRLLKAGISKEETAVQMKDVIFAGTDTTAMNLATILWWLAKRPDVHDKLRQEILHSETPSSTTAPITTSTSSSSPSTFLTGGTNTLPYLDAVIREGLRLSCANPTRLPRVVPSRGWTYTVPAGPAPATALAAPPIEHVLPPGTQISQQTSTLHHNPEVYSDPSSFEPERWLTESSSSSGQEGRKDEEEKEAPLLKQRHRDFFPFGLGARVCIARALATQELILAVKGVVRSGVLMEAGADEIEVDGDGGIDGDGGDVGGERKRKRCRARAVGEGIRIKEWFNAKVVGGRIEVVWE